MADVEAGALREFARKKASAGEGVIAMENLEDDDDDSGGSAQVVDLMEILRKSLGAGVASSAPKAASRKTAAKKRSAGTAATKTAATKAGAKKIAAKTGSSTKSV